MGLGIVISGVFILKVKPNARFVAAWIAFTAVVYAIGMCVLMFVGCPMDDFAGLQLKPKTLVTHVVSYESIHILDTKGWDSLIEIDRDY